MNKSPMNATPLMGESRQTINRLAATYQRAECSKTEERGWKMEDVVSFCPKFRGADGELVLREAEGSTIVRLASEFFLNSL